MRIGVDIDGVLNYHRRFYIECGTKYCAETGKGKLTDPDAGHLVSMFDWDCQTRDNFWDQYGYVQMCVWPAQTYAAEVIRKLREEGHEIWIITGRNNNDQIIQNMLAPTWEETTKIWLSQNQIEYDQICFNHQDKVPTDKGTFCAENHVELMIEDNPDYLQTLIGKTQPIVFDTPYNRTDALQGLPRVYSWYDVYAKIKEMEQI